MVKLTFLVRASYQEETPYRLIITADKTYRKEVYFFWGLLLVFAMSLFSVGIYAIFQNTNAYLGLWCGFMLLFLTFIFALTAKTNVEIIVDPLIETIKITQNRIFRHDLNSNTQTFSLAKLQKPQIKSRGNEMHLVLMGAEWKVMLRFKDHGEALIAHAYFRYLHRKTATTLMSNYPLP